MQFLNSGTKIHNFAEKSHLQNCLLRLFRNSAPYCNYSAPLLKILR